MHRESSRKKLLEKREELAEKSRVTRQYLSDLNNRVILIRVIKILEFGKKRGKNYLHLIFFNLIFVFPELLFLLSWKESLPK